MKEFDVQGIELNVPLGKALAFTSDPAQSPRWTKAFARVASGQAVLRTPSGEIMIDLAVETSLAHGTVDWRMTFPDCSVATAFSRIVEMNRDRCFFSFVHLPPPGPLEQLEGALEAQSWPGPCGSIGGMLEEPDGHSRWPRRDAPTPVAIVCRTVCRGWPA